MQILIVSVAVLGLLWAVAGASQVSTRKSTPEYQLEGQDPVQDGPEEDRKTTNGSAASWERTEVSGEERNLGKCGVSNLQSTRILGGWNAEKGNFPWRVSIGRPSDCSGTIISPRWVLTTASCLRTEPWAENPEVFYGDVKLTKSRRVRVVERVVHSYFNENTLENDIALLKLAKNLSFTKSDVAPVCLPCSGDEKMTRKVVTSGWGLVANFASTDTLQMVHLDVISISKCQQLMGGYIGGTNMCTHTAGANVNRGDGGTSIDALWKGKWHAIGISSWGIPYRNGVPTVHTRIAVYISWIESVTGEKFCSK